MSVRKRSKETLFILEIYLIKVFQFIDFDSVVNPLVKMGC